MKLHCRCVAIDSSSTPPSQDGSPLVCHESETASDSTGSDAGRRGPHNPRRLCTGSGHLSGLRHLHEVTHLEDCVELLCCSSTDPQHTLLCPQAGGAFRRSGRSSPPDVFFAQQAQSLYLFMQTGQYELVFPLLAVNILCVGIWRCINC